MLKAKDLNPASQDLLTSDTSFMIFQHCSDSPIHHMEYTVSLSQTEIVTMVLLKM